MKFVYIKSGYKGIYSFFDQWLEEAAILKNALIDSLPPSINPQELNSILFSSNPSFVLVMIGDKIPFTLLNVIKKQNLPIVIWLTEDPFYIDISVKVLPFADYILTIDKSACQYYQTLGYKNTRFFPLATSTEIFKPFNLGKEIDLLMVGYPYPNRVQLVEYLLSNTEYSLTLIGDKWRKFLKVNSQKRKKLQLFHRWMKPTEVNKFYNKSKIILNPHREFTFKLNKNTIKIENRSVNNRFLDIFSSGGFQLINNFVDPPENVPNKLFLHYSDEEDCRRKIDDCMTKNHLMEDISVGCEEIRTEHTFLKRIEQLLEIITSSHT